MITNDKLNEILANADKATAGNWRTEECGSKNCWCKCVETDVHENGVSGAGSLNVADATYIASVDPPTIKTIIEELLQFRQGRTVRVNKALLQLNPASITHIMDKYDPELIVVGKFEASCGKCENVAFSLEEHNEHQKTHS